MRSIMQALVMLIKTMKSGARTNVSFPRQTALKDEPIGRVSAGRRYFGFRPCFFFLVPVRATVSTAAAATAVAVAAAARSVDWDVILCPTEFGGVGRTARFQCTNEMTALII